MGPDHHVYASQGEVSSPGCSGSTHANAFPELAEDYATKHAHKHPEAC